MQVHDAVATVHRLHLQLEVPIGRIDRHHLHAGGGGGHLHAGNGRRDGHVLVPAVGLRVGLLVEADVDRFATRVFGVHRQQQVGYRVNGYAVDGLRARELVVAVAVRGGWQCVAAPCVAGELAFADRVLVNLLDDEHDRGDAVAAVAARYRIQIGHHAGSGDVEVVVGERVVERGPGIDRVAIDRVALHDMVVHMQVHDAVATIGGSIFQDKIAIGGVLHIHPYFRADGVHRHACARCHGDADTAVLAVVECLGGLPVKTQRHIVRTLGCRLHRQFQI